MLVHAEPGAMIGIVEDPYGVPRTQFVAKIPEAGVIEIPDGLFTATAVLRVRRADLHPFECGELDEIAVGWEAITVLQRDGSAWAGREPRGQ